MTELRNNTFDALENLLDAMKSDSVTKAELQKKLEILRNTKLNILVVGATGVGKSSTINAIFNTNIAKVGYGSTPETKEIKSYTMKHTIIWDTPGLGDSTENDARFAKMIQSKLEEKDERGNGIIDLVLCILDGASRDLGTTYNILKNTIIPSLGTQTDRLIIAINKADIARSGLGWDETNNQPDEKLRDFLEQKVESTKQRLLEDTDIEFTPIYYSAGFTEDGLERKPYNISKLLHKIMLHLQAKKRSVILRDVNPEKENFQQDDKNSSYNEETVKMAEKSTWETVKGVAQDILDFINKNKEILTPIALEITKFIKSKLLK
ncbi:GTPase family protein [Pasteurella multocida]|uniref:GTPase family protein n=1 Tax=Pasteurella multocida TaxID=747 RepID=UPI0028DDCEEF|nr:GTPase [Pasteurella multocida]MEB3456589.1 GTPase [Pasteurella multocida]MEB3487658.1 GTPase [Pasteurella multocida]MEB3491174.1 GTPase [Pasteurella multocida]WRK07040.1 GTPase [Pasteurella multocida]HDR0613031.1 50S ribosome-binding GTPase [Pasteurella multocida]